MCVDEWLHTVSQRWMRITSALFLSLNIIFLLIIQALFQITIDFVYKQKFLTTKALGILFQCLCIKFISKTHLILMHFNYVNPIWLRDKNYNLYLVILFQFTGKPMYWSNSASPNLPLILRYFVIASTSSFLNIIKSSLGSKYLKAMTKLNKSLFP